MHRRDLLMASAMLPGMVGARALSAGSDQALTPEMFGAKGDGRTDDSAAFARLSAKVTADGGGTIVLRRTTYIVGTQRPGRDGRLSAAELMVFKGCAKPLTIRGNGARLRCAAGQRYGVFQADGTPKQGQNRRKDGGVVQRPYRHMILVEQCTGAVEIDDIELDGNQDAHVVGGKYGDKGWQIATGGLALRNNSGPETLTNVHSHHHAQDGFYIDGVDRATPGVRRRLIGLRADANGRQGMSIVGGRGYELSGCSFTRTARGRVASAPAAGLDIEAQRGKKIRNLRLSDCRFADNRGCGMVADSGDSADVRFVKCSFIGTSNWSAWPRKPGFAFDSCLFVGTLVHAFGDPDPAKAARFVDCDFRDDPKLSPTGKLTMRKNLIADLSRAQNVLFDRCRFLLTHDGVLPWSVGPIYRDCIMSQRSDKVAHTRGTFQGRNRITGPVAIGRSIIQGSLELNGTILERNG
ncbi:hypothetical protein D1610_14885 [Sphingomonas gilva]|uniref:Right-handed parallel beta-helix repeat-containing protein n=1 Tax=Sphingomonas gilva TaxID=2305907 RepID=A0A396RKB3_9SPHN|nr:hypothetical protein D1610_14885 [Sphingomonas gilva]